MVVLSQKIKEKSLGKTDALLSGDDVVLTLCTCFYEFDGARFVLHARLINESIVDTGLRRSGLGKLQRQDSFSLKPYSFLILYKNAYGTFFPFELWTINNCK